MQDDFWARISPIYMALHDECERLFRDGAEPDYVAGYLILKALHGLEAGYGHAEGRRVLLELARGWVDLAEKVDPSDGDRELN
jgi:hypothetical protein